MRASFTNLVLGATIFAQYCAAYSLHKRDAQFSNRSALYQNAATAYTTLLRNTITSSKDYLVNSSTEIAALSKPNGAMRDLKQKIDTLLLDIEKSAHIDDTQILQLVVLYSKLVIFPLEYRDNDDQAMINLLNHNGANEFLENFKSGLVGFMVSFSTAVDQYIQGLPTEKRENEAELIQWYAEYQSIQNIRAKFQKCSEFFIRFDPAESVEAQEL